MRVLLSGSAPIAPAPARVACFCVAFLVVTSCDDGTARIEGVTVYERPDFGGNVQTFGGDVVDLENVPGPCTGRGFFDDPDEMHWDDCISSIRLWPGWTVTIYEHDEYEGESLTISADVRNLGVVRGPCGNDWDDCISSLQVTVR